MSGHTIWDAIPAAATHDNPFSQEAAAAILGHAGSVRREVAACIAKHEPIAAWDIELWLPYGGNTIRPRLRELEDSGVITRRGEGITPSGRRCATYVLTDLGARMLG